MNEWKELDSENYEFNITHNYEKRNDGTTTNHMYNIKYRKRRQTHEELRNFHIANVNGCIPSQLRNALLFLLEQMEVKR